MIDKSNRYFGSGGKAKRQAPLWKRIEKLKATYHQKITKKYHQQIAVKSQYQQTEDTKPNTKSTTQQTVATDTNSQSQQTDKPNLKCQSQQPGKTNAKSQAQQTEDSKTNAKSQAQQTEDSKSNAKSTKSTDSQTNNIGENYSKEQLLLRFLMMNINEDNEQHPDGIDNYDDNTIIIDNINYKKSSGGDINDNLTNVNLTSSTNAVVNLQQQFIIIQQKQIQELTNIIEDSKNEGENEQMISDAIDYINKMEGGGNKLGNKLGENNKRGWTGGDNKRGKGDYDEGDDAQEEDERAYNNNNTTNNTKHTRQNIEEEKEDEEKNDSIATLRDYIMGGGGGGKEEGKEGMMMME